MGYELGKGFIDCIVSDRSTAFSHLEDFADRLNHFFSTLIILMLAGVTMTNVYFLRPISCTLPTAPSNKFNEFAEAICWVTGTMALSETDKMPMNTDDWRQARQKSDISFYQWVPFCLSVQAMLFFIPHILWQSLAMYTMGENLEALLVMARNANMSEDQNRRRKLVDGAAYQLYRLARQHRDARSSRWARIQRQLANLPGGTIFATGKRMGNWVMLAYLLVKSLYLANAIGQLYIIRTFLSHERSLLKFGQKLVGTLTSKREWSESELFPRQTYCPVPVRHLGARDNVYTAICALPVNIFNEKIYIFLWFWIVMVSVVTSISLLMWLSRAFLHHLQNDFIRDYLILSLHGQQDEPGTDHPKDCSACTVTGDDPSLKRFLHEFVRIDGAFLLRMIRSNAGDVLGGEILVSWWHMFKKFQESEESRVASRTFTYEGVPRSKIPGTKIQDILREGHVKEQKYV